MIFIRIRLVNMLEVIKIKCGSCKAIYECFQFDSDKEYKFKSIHCSSCEESFCQFTIQTVIGVCNSCVRNYLREKGLEPTELTKVGSSRWYHIECRNCQKEGRVVDGLCCYIKEFMKMDAPERL
jgi:hypothetical protein